MNIITELQGIAPQFRKLHPENEASSLDEIIVPRELITMKKQIIQTKIITISTINMVNYNKNTNRFKTKIVLTLRMQVNTRFHLV